MSAGGTKSDVHFVDLPNGFTPDEVLAQAAGFYPNFPAKAQSWLITAQSIFEDHFNVQFTTYKWHLAEGRAGPAGKILSHITNNIAEAYSHPEFIEQIMLVTNSVRCKNSSGKAEDAAKYAAIFDSLEHDVQRKVLLCALERVDVPVRKINLLLLILNRYTYKGSDKEVEALVHLMVSCYLKDPLQFERMLIEDTLPLIDRMCPKLTASAVNGIFTISMEFYMRKITEDERKPTSTDMWKNVFYILHIFARTQKWQSFKSFDEKSDFNVYWDKLLAIMSVSPVGSNCVLCYATVLFLYSLHGYMKGCNSLPDDRHQVNYVLMEGFADLMGTTMRREVLEKNTIPEISATTDATKKISSAFVVATKCWQLLNSDQFAPEFTSVISSLPVSQWMPAFTLDMSQYFGFRQEAICLINDTMANANDLVSNLKKLSVILICGRLTPNAMQLIMNILSDLPKRQGNYVKLTREDVQRHVIFLPLERCAIVQYCARAIIEHLRWTKFYLPNCTMKTMLHLLILSQLEFPFESQIVFDILHCYDTRKRLALDNTASYIINLYILGEIFELYMTHVYGQNQYYANINSDRDFLAYVNTQKMRANDNIVDVMVAFIMNEMNAIMLDLFVLDRDYSMMESDEGCEITFAGSHPTHIPTNIITETLDYADEQEYMAMSTGSASNAMLIGLPEYTGNMDAETSDRVHCINEQVAATVPVGMPVSVITNNLPPLPPLTAMPVGVITPTPNSQFLTAPANDINYSHSHGIMVQPGMSLPPPLVATNLTTTQDNVDLLYID